MTQPLPGPQLPWPSCRRPLSVVTFGNSIPSLMLPPRADRGQGTYSEVLADLLNGRGVPTTVHVESDWFGFLTKALREYPRRVRPHVPDVVILQFGINELQPWLAPVWLVKHLMTKGRATTRAGRAYRKLVAPHLWRALRGYRRRVAPLVGLRTWQTTPRRFRNAMQALLTQTRVDGRPLVLVLDIEQPTEVLRLFLPGIDRRHAIYQELLAQIVASFGDSEVRLVPITEISATVPRAALDGMHYTAAGHHAIGEHLCHEVLGWLETRGARA